MAIYDLWLSRNNGPTIANYVGHTGRLFYDPAERVLRISDGVTAGGTIMTYPVASSTQIGGVKLGPGVVLNGSGQIIIDSEGLDFSFGDFTGIVGSYTDETEYALLSSINVDEDIVIASNGTGDIKVVGGFEVFATNGTVTGSLEDAEPFFRILDDGQVRILVPLADTTEGGMEIIGSLLGTALAPGQAGTMLHLTGNADLPTRVYHDTLGDYGSYVFRRYNGSVATPTQVLANEDIARFNWTAANNAGMPNQATAQIRVTALENQTTTAQGSKIVFTVTPVGSPTSARVDVATISTADGVSATKFTGPLTGNVTGDVSGTAGSVAAANITGTTLAATVVTSSLTTVGTLGSLTVTNLVTAKNYSGQARNAGTVAAGAGNEITIDFATDHIVRCNYSTEPIQVGFTNYSAGKTVTLIATNTSGINRQLAIGIAAANTQGVTTLDVNNATTAIVTYYCTGTTVDDVFASTVYSV